MPRLQCAQFLLWALLVLAGVSARAQDAGSVAGVVVSSWDGTPLSSVTVTVRGTTLATQTDASGRYELKNVPPGDQVLRFSKSSYASAVVTDARVLPGQNTTVNGNLRPEFHDMEEYEVTAEEFTEQTSQIMFDRQQSSSMLDAIGSEQFSKLGASDAGAIMAKVTGVSVVGGKYVVVRGLADRYTRTLLNGLEVPSADPYRTSPQLDLFPAAMIDRINVSKTFTPDQPGGTGGGMIDIVTKSFPEKPFVKASFGTSYNENSNLKKNFLAAPQTSMAMFAIPSSPQPLDPALFGLTAPPPRPGPAGTRETEASAVARRQLANDAQGLLQDLGAADFAGVSKSSPLNSSFGGSAGGTVPLFGNNFGMFGGINYNRVFRMIENGTMNRYNYDGSPNRLGAEDRGNVVTDYGANVNLGYDLSEYAQFGFNFMMANSTDQEARHGTYPFTEGREDQSLERWAVRYTDREIYNYQLHGHHELPVLADSKVDWAVGLADTTQNEPDQLFMNYFLDPNGQATFGDAAMPYPQYPARYWREIEEKSLNYRVDWTLPLSFLKGDSTFLNEDGNLKAGYFSSSTDRDFQEQYFAYDGSTGFNPSNPNSYLNDPAYLQYVTSLGNPPFTSQGVGRTNYTFSRYVRDTFSHPYTASLDVNAVYLMGDFGVLPWLRLIGGARWETTVEKLDAGQAGLTDIDQTDVLPAVSTVITLWTNLNLRLSYGQTVARPSLRELSPYDSYESDLGVVFRGNPDLTMIAMTSYDARLEWYPNSGDILSMGFFYKEVTDPIEYGSVSADDELIEPFNRVNKPATLMGVEFEARKSLEFITPQLKGLTLGANITLIQSVATLSDLELVAKRSVNPDASDTRPLYGQSPYIINLDLNYDHPTSGTSFVIGANLTGERLVLVNTRGPDVYEHPPTSLDVAISQKFWKHWTARFSVRNLLDPVYLTTYGSSPDGNVFQSYTRGRTFGVSLSAEF